MKRYILAIILSLSFGFLLADGCDLPVDNILLNLDGSVFYNASSNIGGFQFNVDGTTINSASGGDATNAGFMISASGSTVIGFSFSGATFGPCGTMLNLDLSGDATGLSEIIIATVDGSPIDFTYYEGSWDCAGTPNGDAVVDNCGTCDSDLTNDCVQDCSGEWGGDTIIDECGVCYGDGSDDLGCGCFEAGPSGCDNVCGSTLVDDACGVCGGDNSSCMGCMDITACNYNDTSAISCDDCCDYPNPGSNCSPFEFNISTLQAFYFFQNITDVYGEPLASNDWVAAFKGDLCVGSRQWDTSVCQGAVCEVPVMGDDGSYYTEGYMISGEIPTFKIYDASENQIFYAIPSESVPWWNFGIPYIQSMYASESYQVNLFLHPHNNLISFLTLPENPSVSSVLESITPTADRILTDGHGSQYTDGMWIGSLEYLDTYSGYWMRLAEFDTLTFVSGVLNPNKIYDLVPELNLISYPAPGFVGVGEGLPDDIESSINYIIGESEATYQLGDGNWVGSMESFRGGKGYWFSAESALSFAYNAGEYSLMTRVVHIEKPELPEEYKVYLSTAKAFYFVDVSNVDQGGYLLSYCGNTLTGARQWNGKIIDIPVMGIDSNEETAGFCSIGEIPRFEYIESNGITHKLHGDIQSYEPNAVQMVGTMDEVPVQFNVLKAYPNPFNPSTNVSFELNQQSKVQLAVYDIKGAFVEEIINDIFNMGSHTYIWDASAYPSGVYMLQLSTNSGILTQKVILLK